MSDPTTPEQTTGQPLTPANIKTINQLPHLEDIDPDDVILVQDVSQNTYRKSSLQAVVDRMNPVKSVNLTRDEYDALPEVEKLNGTYYNITDDALPPYQAYFNVQFPVGYVYEQLPPTIDEDGITRTPQDPNALFNNDLIHSTWKKLNYSGAFFRADGDSASVFGTGMQEAQLPNIKGTINMKTYASANEPTGAFKQTWSDPNVTPSGTNKDVNRNVTFNAHDSNATYVDGGEVRPTNFTVIKWIRIA